MTTPLLAAGGAVLVGAGLVTIATAFLAPAAVTTPPRFNALRLRAHARPAWARSSGGRVAVVVAAAAGVVVWVVTGLAVAAVILPAAAVVVPSLLRVPNAKRAIKRLEAMEEWTRNLAGVLTVGVGPGAGGHLQSAHRHQRPVARNG